MWQDALRIVKDYLPHKVDTHSHTGCNNLMVCVCVFSLSWTNFRKRWLQKVAREL